MALLKAGQTYAGPACRAQAWPTGKRRLGRSPAQGMFDGEEIAGLPEPVQRYLNAVGTDRWPEGEFFRFQITHLRPLNPGPSTSGG